MTVRNLTTIAMLAVAAFATGCAGGDCDALCKEMNACDGAAMQDWQMVPGQPPGPLDCAKVCATDVLNEKASCEDQFDELWKCVSNRDDVCQAQYGCEDRFDFYADCLAGYCINKQADRGLNPLGDDQTDKDCTALGL